MRYWPTTGDTELQVADLASAYEALLEELSDVDDVPSVQQATFASAEASTLADYFLGLAAKATHSAKGQAHAQLAVRMRGQALQAMKRAREIAAEVRAERARDVVGDGREVFR